MSSSKPQDGGPAAQPGKKCIFCGVSKEKGFDILEETDTVVVFRDRSPGAKEHLLAVPKQHTGSVSSLSATDVEMIQDLHSTGTAVLSRLGFDEASQRFGFHIPPFATVPHLHLHCLGLPFRSSFQSFVFRPSGVTSLPPSDVSSPNAGKPKRLDKGWGWFVTADQATAILERGDRVRVGGSSHA